MRGLLTYGLLKRAAWDTGTNQEQSDKKYNQPGSALPNDGRVDPDPRHQFSLNDTASHANRYYNTNSPVNWQFGPEEGINRNTPWYRNPKGKSIEISTAGSIPHNKAHEYVFNAPAQSSRGFGGGFQDIHFNPTSGRYEDYGGSPPLDSMNQTAGISKQPHMEYDEATGKYFRPAQGTELGPKFMGLTPASGNNPATVKAINPAYIRARKDWDQRNDPNSVLGKQKNNMDDWLRNDTSGTSFANWKNTPAMNTLQNQGTPGTGLPRGQTSPTPAQTFKKNAPANIKNVSVV